MREKDFLQKLQSEAKIQADLSQDFLFPRRLAPLSSFIFNHTFPVVFFTSLVCALATLIIINL